MGWRDNALRLLLIATESAYHYAGDGSAYLAGISKPNDGKCHTDISGRYTKFSQLKVVVIICHYVIIGDTLCNDYFWVILDSTICTLTVTSPKLIANSP